MDYFAPNPPSAHVYDIKFKFEPFYMLWNEQEEVVKLPTLFNQKHINEIGDNVVLADPAGNMFQLAVEKRLSQVYFTEGWEKIGKFYGVMDGCWVRLVFVAYNMFLIEIKNRLDVAVNYPLPATIHLLRGVPVTVDYPREHPLPTHFSTICNKPDFFHTLDKTLTHSDVTSDLLHIPLGFCQAAFRRTDRKILMFDEYGRNATGVVDFEKELPAYCGIIQGWKDFCNERGYFEGIRVQLAVPYSNPTVMIVSFCHSTT